MKKIVLFLFILVSFMESRGQTSNACYPNPLNGTKALQPGQSQKLTTYKIVHEFTLYPSFNFAPKIYLVSFNHSWVNEPSPLCKTFKVKPATQPGTFKNYGKDTIINGIPYNNQAKVDTTLTWIGNAGYNRIDSAFSTSCVSRAKATTCITVDSVKNNSVSGVIQSFGFSQTINPPINSSAYAFSWCGVSVEDGQPLKQGDIGWQPQIEQGKTGKSRNIRQKAGSNDPVTFNVHDYVTNLDTSGTLLSIVMRHQMEDDTLDVLNYWKNDTVHIESDSLLFKVEFPSPFTASQGFIYLWVQNGFVLQAQKTGVFNSVPLPLTGTPVPFSFPFDNLINFHYNLDTSGLFNGDSIKVTLFMDGNNENPEIETYDPRQIIPAVSRPSCNGGNDGAISLYINYGSQPYNYLWSNGSTTKDITGCSAGNYFVMVTDSSGVPATQSIVVTDPPQLFVTGSKTDVFCNGGKTGSITLVTTGGTPGYSYLWNSGSTNSNRTLLKAGTYTVTVTDSKGCTTSASFTISQPPAITIAKTQVNVKCFGKCNGSISLSTSGGITPYAYTWSNGSSTSAINSLCAGTYVCTVTDANGCTKSKTIVITQPSQLLLSVSPSGPVAATALVTGGSPPYTYKWFTVPVQTTATATGLVGGNVYKVKVTDVYGCSVIVFFTMPIIRQEMPNDKENEIELSPNPCNAILVFSFQKVPVDGCKIELTDATGRRLLTYNVWKKIESINMSDFKDGIYFIKFNSRNSLVVKKIVKQSR